jgi:hypothetical protein
MQEAPMPTFEDPAADADEVQQALRGLAHATRSIDDPRQIYPLLGSLTSAVASLSQALHQIASIHDGPARKTAWMSGDSRTGRAAAYQVSWELHRSGEMLRHVAESIGHAHEAEATIAYDHRDFPGSTDAPRPSANHGLRL